MTPTSKNISGRQRRPPVQNAAVLLLVQFENEMINRIQFGDAGFLPDIFQAGNVFLNVPYHGAPRPVDQLRMPGLVQVVEDDFFTGSPQFHPRQLFNQVEKGVQEGLFLVDMGLLSAAHFKCITDRQ
jgi:hypothetical protein